MAAIKMNEDRMMKANSYIELSFKIQNLNLQHLYKIPLMIVIYLIEDNNEQILIHESNIFLNESNHLTIIQNYIQIWYKFEVDQSIKYHVYAHKNTNNQDKVLIISLQTSIAMIMGKYGQVCLHKLTSLLKPSQLQSHSKHARIKEFKSKIYDKSLNLDHNDKAIFNIKQIDNDTRYMNNIKISELLNNTFPKKTEINNILHFGDLVIKLEKLMIIQNEYAVVKCGGQKLKKSSNYFGISNPFFILNKIDYFDHSIMHLYTSEKQPNNQNPAWIPFELPLSKITPSSDNELNLSFEVFNAKTKTENKLIGSINTNLKKLKEKSEFDLNKNNKKGPRGKLTFLNLSIYKRYDFLEYIQGGLSFNIMIGIDFTSSNGDLKSSNSLHFTNNNGHLNDYQSAIFNVCNILLKYTHDQKAAMFGFGAKPFFPNFSSADVHHCFPLTGIKSNPYVVGMNGIMETYKKAVLEVQMWGPTIYSDIINQALLMAQEVKIRDNIEYNILLLLTDGELQDVEKACDCIMKASKLPLSIIIIGIGNENFGFIENLKRKWNHYGINGNILRECFNFLPLAKYKNDIENFRKDLLSKIPEQVKEYLQKERKAPIKKVEIDPKKLEYENDEIFTYKIKDSHGNDQEIKSGVHSLVLPPVSLIEMNEDYQKVMEKNKLNELNVRLEIFNSLKEPRKNNDQCYPKSILKRNMENDKKVKHVQFKEKIIMMLEIEYNKLQQEEEEEEVGEEEEEVDHMSNNCDVSKEELKRNFNIKIAFEDIIQGSKMNKRRADEEVYNEYSIYSRYISAENYDYHDLGECEAEKSDLCIMNGMHESECNIKKKEIFGVSSIFLRHLQRMSLIYRDLDNPLIKKEEKGFLRDIVAKDIE